MNILNILYYVATPKIALVPGTHRHVSLSPTYIFCIVNAAAADNLAQEAKVSTIMLLI